MAAELISKNDDFSGSIIKPINSLMELMLLDVCNHLQKVHPKNFWHAMSTDGSTVAIRALDISSKIGYVLHATTIQADPDLKCVTRAGGELLERAGLSRENKGSMTATHLDTTASANQLDPKFHNNKTLATKLC